MSWGYYIPKRWQCEYCGICTPQGESHTCPTSNQEKDRQDGYAPTRGRELLDVAAECGDEEAFADTLAESEKET